MRVLEQIADRYERTRAARTGQSVRDFTIDYEELLASSGASDGDAREVAERDLARAAAAGIVTIVTHKRDPRLIQQLRISAAQEELLFERLGRPSPAARRRGLAQQFATASSSAVPDDWREAWSVLCSKLEEAAQCGDSIAPFFTDDPTANAEILDLIPRLLSWRGESLIRFASCVLCGDSKRLGVLSHRLSHVLGRLSLGRIQSLEDLGILNNPRFALVAGPIKLQLSGEWLNFGALRGAFRISEVDIRAAEQVSTTAQRCLTIENETTFHELGKLTSGELLIQTSYPGSATLALIAKLPESMEFWHFGDTDPEGFEILRDLRDRTRRPFRSFKMTFRKSDASADLSVEQQKRLLRLASLPTMATERGELEQMLADGRIGIFEQEALGRPSLSGWPFYK